MRQPRNLLPTRAPRLLTPFYRFKNKKCRAAFGKAAAREHRISIRAAVEMNLPTTTLPCAESETGGGAPSSGRVAPPTNNAPLPKPDLLSLMTSKRGGGNLLEEEAAAAAAAAGLTDSVVKLALPDTNHLRGVPLDSPGCIGWRSRAQQNFFKGRKRKVPKVLVQLFDGEENAAHQFS